MEQTTRTSPYGAKTIQRFWDKVDRSSDCWTWTGTQGTHGHGSMKINGKNVGAHRVSYELHVGSIPPGLVIDHICHNPSCVKPLHLRAVKQKQNMEHRVAAHANSKSGVRGVSWHTARQKWYVTVKHNGKSVHGGSFHTMDEAEAAAIELRNRLFTHNDADRLAKTR
ncbi:HNH endonuclease [Arthrobacter sp. EpRS71]|uniref:HNH endonuclease n=1 Tax=Arthrobacter sp. EpRS71 TaxID=1743141 RepID=UPI000749EB46|nr:HNH endonuclease [Arthrobacter sp. EpRS71]KUM34550.1 hypothetical protein AR689_10430 [Arthrobacter sp. EpRS71]